MNSVTSIYIHFVCTGNIYRSRIAEAYLRSKQISNLIISSSGTNASIQHKGPITWYALRLLYRHHLLPYMTNSWSDTLSDNITKSDIVIFIGENNFEFCKEHFPLPKKYEIWDLPDFNDNELNGKPLDLVHETEYITISEKMFLQIKEKTDKLIKNL